MSGGPPDKEDADAGGATETAPEVLRPRAGPLLLITAAAVMFLGMGVLLMAEGDPGLWFLGFGCAMIFGGGGLAAVVLTALPGANYLLLDSDGITLRHHFRERTYAWADIRGFGIFTVRGNRMVVFDVVRSHPESDWTISKANRALCGFSHSLPNVYGDSPEDLVAALEARHRLALGGG